MTLQDPSRRQTLLDWLKSVCAIPLADSVRDDLKTLLGLTVLAQRNHFVSQESAGNELSDPTWEQAMRARLIDMLLAQLARRSAAREREEAGHVS